MPISQGSYLETSTDLREGEITYAGVTTDQLSGVNASGAILPFGRGVIYHSTATGMMERCTLTLPSAAGQVIRGVAVATDTIERQQGVTVDANSNPGYPVAGNATVDMMSYCTKGMIAVKTIEAVVKGDAVTCLITAGATQGQFGKTADATRIACPSTWEWATTTASGAIGQIYLK